MGNRKLSTQGIIFLFFIVFIALAVINRPQHQPIQFMPSSNAKLINKDNWQTIELHSNTKMVHASFIEQLPNNRQIVFWFGGSREGHKDVQIYRSILSDGEIIESPTPVLSAPKLSELSGRYIKKLGNPVAKYHEGKLYLWVVSVSVGGWATAKVDMLVSEDEGETFVYGEKLNTSPFFNISTLIRNPLVEIDQGFLLPAYFELNRLDPIMVRLDNHMRMVQAQTLPMGAIQPIVIPNQGGGSAQVYARPIEQKAVQHGQWQPESAKWITTSINDLPNDSSDSAIVRLSANKLLMVHNGGQGRGQLLISLTEDNGSTWKKIATLENKSGERYAYPAMIIGSDGMLHITYTWQREHIQYIRASLSSILAGDI
ncbi:exo-alpha-sialidase [Reinekea sp.]|jgi:predicted neuraminidase|uniref:exo-alpha-sialidase n=1 Tax=Reinekea sp. TaxID=1970455 RepID=UPI003989E0DF